MKKHIGEVKVYLEDKKNINFQKCKKKKIKEKLNLISKFLNIRVMILIKQVL